MWLSCEYTTLCVVLNEYNDDEKKKKKEKNRKKYQETLKKRITKDKDFFFFFFWIKSQEVGTSYWSKIEETMETDF